MLNPFACEPLTLKLDSADGGYVGQMSITFPFTEPDAEPLSEMLPFDQTSPVMLVVEVPVNVNEGAEPLQLPGLRVWIAAPYWPGGLATAVAVAPPPLGCPAPSPCMVVTPAWGTAGTRKPTPPVGWSVAGSGSV